MVHARLDVTETPVQPGTAKDEIADFQELCRLEYGEEITREQAEDGLTRLVAFYKLALEMTEPATGIPQTRRSQKAAKANNASRPTYHKEVDHD